MTGDAIKWLKKFEEDRHLALTAIFADGRTQEIERRATTDEEKKATLGQPYLWEAPEGCYAVVSTVDLVVPMLDFETSTLVYFETMVFYKDGKDHDEIQYRCSTSDEALACHRATIQSLLRAIEGQ